MTSLGAYLRRRLCIASRSCISQLNMLLSILKIIELPKTHSSLLHTIYGTHFSHSQYIPIELATFELGWCDCDGLEDDRKLPIRAILKKEKKSGKEMCCLLDHGSWQSVAHPSHSTYAYIEKTRFLSKRKSPALVLL